MRVLVSSPALLQLLIHQQSFEHLVDCAAFLLMFRKNCVLLWKNWHKTLDFS